MKVRYNFTITLKRDNKLETKVFKKVDNFEVVQQTFFYMSFMGKVSDEQSSNFGEYVSKAIWIPIKDIVKIEAKIRRIFGSKKEKSRFIKEEIMGIRPPSPQRIPGIN